MSRLIDADKLKQHYAWWEGGSREMTMDEAKRNFDTIIDVQPIVDIDAITESHEKIGYDKGLRDGYAQATVDAVPTEFHDKCMQIEIEKRFELELKEKHGHWINHFDDLFPEDSSVECSVCHEYEGIMANDNYCPNCGAKMDEVEDAEEE